MYLLDVFRRSPAPIVAIGLFVGAAAAAAAETERYTYFRSLEGEADLSSSDGSRAEAETNYPILVGDRLRLGPNGRADVLLADGSQLTVAGGSELVFDDLAYSADGPAEGNVLRLVEGRLVLVSHGAWAGEHDQPIVDTQNARVYLKENGSYVVTATTEGFTEVTVRDGFAEVVDQRGSSIARAGESVEVVGASDPRAEVLAARGETEIEAWARDQEARFGRGSDPYLEEPLESTATLAEHGEWLQVDSRRAWRPYVTVKSWRPYFNGRWAHTPRGLYWVSSDPWSPVTYHYGSWEYDMYHGWVWYPAYTWAPAHVYWYWGPSYTAWVPIGYYSRHYRGHYPGFGLRFGHYGWVGGHWDPFYDWTFCPSGYLRNRWPHRYYRSGRDFAHHGALERGILTTDTRHLGRNEWDRPELVRVAIERGWRAERGQDLPDVNRFVERPSELPENVARQVLLKPNPTGRGFDERVAAVLPTSGGREGSATGADTTSSRRALPAGPIANGGAAGDRRVASRQGGNDDAARTAAPGSGVGQRAVGSRPTVSRDGSSPSAGQRTPSADSGSTRPGAGSSGAGVRSAVPRAQPGADSSATGDRRSTVQRAPVPRTSTAPSAGASSDRRATVQRSPVPRAATPPAASAGSDRRSTVQRAPVPRADSPTASQGADDRRSTVQRAPVPRTSTAPPASSATSRQSVGTPREPVRRVVDGIRGRSRPTGTTAAAPSASRPTVQRSPVPRSSAAAAPSASRPAAARQPVSRAPSSTQSAPQRRPVTTSPPPRSAGASSRSTSTPPRESVSRAPVRSRPAVASSSRAGSGGYERQPVRTPSRPSYATPSASTRSAPAARAPSSAASRPTYSRPARATTPSYGSSRPTTSSTYARPSASRSSSPTVSRSAPQRPSAASSAPTSRGSSGSSRATAPARSGSSSSRATASSSRPSGRPGSNRPGSGGDR